MTIHYKNNYSLKEFNTFGIDVSAMYFIDIHSLEELKHVILDEQRKQWPLLILGGGSNVLFTSDFAGLVIHNCLKGIEVVSENEEEVFVRSASGEVWHDLVMFAVNHGWGGIENLSLIPGSVGASPMQNIGAYGVEIKDTFHALEAMDLNTGELVVFRQEDCEFGYRESVFKHKYQHRFFITSVTFRLKKNPVLNTSYGAISQELSKNNIISPGIKDVSNAVISIRRSKLPDPKVLGNAGSFFKNPEVSTEEYQRIKRNFPEVVAYALENGNYKLAAGWLIEQCGWKGRQVGHTGAHKDQALVIVNYGGANGLEIQDLARNIRESVQEKFGVWINPEVNII